MRFHVVALPHTVTNGQYSSCAYTEKVRKFCVMMSGLGHQVFHYGVEGSAATGAENVPCLTAEEHHDFFGEAWSPNIVTWNPELPYWELMNRRAASEIRARQQRGDFVCLIGGTCQKPIADAIGDSQSMTVEYGIGYYGTFAKYRVFESYTHQAAVYAMSSKDPDGFLYDAVIPNYFDPADFPFVAQPGAYLLYLARAVRRKGIQIAVEIAKAAGMPLIVAGHGASVAGGQLVTDDGLRFDLRGGAVSYEGPVGPARRAELLGGALALLQPTLYMEPFGGNVVEAQLCGTPSITTDYAAFSETVAHGINGYRCHSLAEFVWAVRNGGTLCRGAIRERAMATYSMKAIAPKYDRYFRLLLTLWGVGWPDLTEHADLQ